MFWCHLLEIQRRTEATGLSAATKDDGDSGQSVAQLNHTLMNDTNATELSPDQIWIHRKGFDLQWAGDLSWVSTALNSPW